MLRNVGSFILTPPPTDLTSPHTIMDMRNNERRNILIHAQVMNFSQSETSLMLRWRGGLNFELLLWGAGGELTEKIRNVFNVAFIIKKTQGYA